MWRTETIGHGQRGHWSESFVHDSRRVSGAKLEEMPFEDRPLDRYGGVRYCPECGTKVCSYKDPKMERVWCYAHDYLTPFTRIWIIGQRHVDRSTHDETWYNEKSERGQVG